MIRLLDSWSTEKKLIRTFTNKNRRDSKGFTSPTDNMLSPCTEKLKNHKTRFFANSKPTKLSFASFNERLAESAKQSNKNNKTEELQSFVQENDENNEDEDFFKKTKKCTTSDIEVNDDEIMKNISMDDI